MPAWFNPGMVDFNGGGGQKTQVVTSRGTVGMCVRNIHTNMKLEKNEMFDHLVELTHSSSQMIENYTCIFNLHIV